MKLRIAETVPGELVTRAVDAVRVIERITGRRLLREDFAKASDKPKKAPPYPEQARFEYRVLDESVKHASVEVERIRKLMVSKMGEVLD